MNEACETCSVCGTAGTIFVIVLVIAIIIFVLCCISDFGYRMESRIDHWVDKLPKPKDDD